MSVPPAGPQTDLQVPAVKLPPLSGEALADAPTTDVWSGFLPPPPGGKVQRTELAQLFTLHLPAHGVEPAALPKLPGLVLLQEIGRGGMGVVYAARQEGLARLVAVKCLVVEWALRPHLLERFQREAETVARLNHPHIVQVYEIRTWEGRPYLVQEYVPGGSLAHRLEGKPQDPHGAAVLTETLARALHHIHAQGLVHRDLKPANILLALSRAPEARAGDGTLPVEDSPACVTGARLNEIIPKIADFGLAKSMADTSDLTHTGMVIGTPHYMAPEQAKGETVGPPTDIYALGAVLYEMLTGRPPFLAATSRETLNQVCEQEPVPPRRLQPAVPRDLETICLKCLEKKPARRYASALALADDLKRFLHQEPILARPVGPVERLGKWVRRKPAQAALVFLAITALTILVVGVLLHNNLLQTEVTRANDKEAEARREKERAQQRYHQARRTLEAMLKHLESRQMSGTPQLLDLQKQQREEALRYYEAVDREGEEADPEIQADAAAAAKTAGTLQYEMGQYAAAEVSLRRAIARYERLLHDRSGPSGSQDVSELLAACHNNLGLTLQNLKQLQESERHLRRALALREELLRAHPDKPTARRGVAETQACLAAFHSVYERRYDLAKDYYRQAAEHLRVAYRQTPEPDLASRLARVQIGLVLMLPKEEPAVRHQHLEEARAVLAKQLQNDPGDTETTLLLGQLYTNWGFIHQQDQQWPAALEKFEQAVALIAPVQQREPNHQFARWLLKNAHAACGHFYVNHFQRYEDAVTAQEKAVQLASGPEQEFQRLFLAEALDTAGHHARAFAEVEKVKDCPSQRRYNHQLHMAIVCSNAMVVVEKDAALPSPEKERLKTLYSQRGMEILRKGRSYLDPKDWPKERQALRTNRAFAPATKLPGFEAFMEEK